MHFGLQKFSRNWFCLHATSSYETSRKISSTNVNLAFVGVKNKDEESERERNEKELENAEVLSSGCGSVGRPDVGSSNPAIGIFYLLPTLLKSALKRRK